MEHKNITTIAKEVRQAFKKRYPEYTLSVTVQRYSMGQSLHLSLMSGPVKPILETYTDYQKTCIDPNPKQYEQVNHYYLKEANTRPLFEFAGLEPNNRPYIRYNPKIIPVLQYAYELTKKDNWDNSDPMTDYFDVNYYVHLNIGKWDKPYEVTGKVEKLASATVHSSKADIALAKMGLEV